MRSNLRLSRRSAIFTPRLELFGNFGEPVPGRRCRTEGRRDELGDGRIQDWLLTAFGPAVPVGDPPLGASGQQIEAWIVRGPVECRVVLEVDSTELWITDRVALVVDPDGRLLRRDRLHENPEVALHLHRALAHAKPRAVGRGSRRPPPRRTGDRRR